MKINKIYIKNINSLQGEVVIDFDSFPLKNAGIFAITGDTGAGKTTILDAITLALYKQVPRKADVEEVLSFGQIDGYAKVEFESRGNRYLAEFTIRRKGKKLEGTIDITHSVAIFDKEKLDFQYITDKKSETAKKVEEVTGLDHGRFVKSVLLAQGEFAAFINAKPNERSQLLQSITGVEIYEKISIAAYQKHKIEKEKLDNLEVNLQHINLLSEEQILGHQEQILLLNKEIEKNEVEKNALLGQKQDFENFEKAKLKQLENDAKKLIFEQKKPEIDFLQTTFDLQKKISPLEKDIVARKKAMASSVSIQQEIETEQRILDENNQNLITVSNELLAIQSVQNDLLEQKAIEFPKLDKAILLTHSLQSKSEILLQSQSEHSNIEKKIAQIEFQIQTGKEKIELEKLEFDTCKKWLAENEKYESLQENLGKIEEKKAILNDNWKERTALEKQITEFEAEKSLLLSEKENKEFILQDSKNQIAGLKSDFNALGFDFSKNIVEFRQEKVGSLNELIEQKSHFSNLLEYSESHKKLMSELSDYEEKLDSLIVQDIYIHKDILTSLDLIDELQSEYNFRKSTLEMHEYIQKTRNELKEGDKCPICLSTSHYFHSENFEESKESEFVKKAETNFKKVELQLNEMQKNHSKLTTEQDQLRQEIQSFKKLNKEKYEGKIEDAHSNIDQIEEKIANLKEKIEEEKFENADLIWLKKQINKTENEISTLKNILQNFDEMSIKYEVARTQLLTVEKEFDSIQNLLSKISNSLELTLNQSLLNKKKYEEIVNSLDEILSIYGEKFSFDEGKKLFEQLKSIKETYQNFLQKLQFFSEKQLKLENELNILEANQKSEKEKLFKLESEIAQNSENINSLKAEIFSLIGDKNPSLEKANLEQKIESNAKIQKTKIDEKSVIENAIAAQSASLEAKNKQLSTIQVEIENLNQALILALTNLPFESIESLENAFKTSAELKEIEEKLTNFNNEVLLLNQVIENTNIEVEQLEKKCNEIENIDLLNQKIVEIQQDLNEKNQLIGASNNILEADKEAKKRSQDILQKIENQRVEYNRWFGLNKLIGSADGAVFRKFAQTLTLKQLVNLANLHLEKLSGRYIVDTNPNETLQLDIIDVWHADNRRSMATLSGGESFLVSLSLALGLSEMAGRDTQIQSLFIDEGFGTLDESTLDIAIATLENLQSQGKTIGVISHVKELKERISTQIKVVKRGSGYSVVEIV